MTPQKEKALHPVTVDKPVLLNLLIEQEKRQLEYISSTEKEIEDLYKEIEKANNWKIQYEQKLIETRKQIQRIIDQQKKGA